MKQCQALREQPLKKGDYFTPDINHSDKIAKKMEVVEKKVDAIIDKALNKHVNDCIELIMQENDIDEKNEPEVSALLDRFKNEINIAKALDTLSRDDLSNQSTKAHNRQQLLKKIKRLDHAVSKFIDNASAKVSNAQKEVATQVHSICQRLSQRLSQGLKSTQQSMTTMYNQAKASTKKESTQTQLDKEWQKDFADRFANSANFKQPTEDKGPTRPKNN
jgi:L-2-hydroxyglutarate oxidase LhgO